MCSSLRDRGGAWRTPARCAVRAGLAGTRPLYSDLGAAREPRVDTASLQAVQVYVAHELKARGGTHPGRRRTANPWWRNEAVRQPEATAPTIPEVSRLRALRLSLPEPGILAA